MDTSSFLWRFGILYINCLTITITYTVLPRMKASGYIIDIVGNGRSNSFP